MRGPIPGTIHNLCVEFNNKILSPKTNQKQPLAKGNLPNWYTGIPKTWGTQIATFTDGAGRVLPGSKNTPFSILAYQYLCDHKRGCQATKQCSKPCQKKPSHLPQNSQRHKCCRKSGTDNNGAAVSRSKCFIGERAKKGFFSPFFVVISFLRLSWQPGTVLYFRNGRLSWPGCCNGRN